MSNIEMAGIEEENNQEGREIDDREVEFDGKKDGDTSTEDDVTVLEDLNWKTVYEAIYSDPIVLVQIMGEKHTLLPADAFKNILSFIKSFRSLDDFNENDYFPLLLLT